jgi:hypothetical protein
MALGVGYIQGAFEFKLTQGGRILKDEATTTADMNEAAYLYRNNATTTNPTLNYQRTN